MALKMLKTVRVLPDSPGWYWFRAPGQSWEPLQVEWHDAKSQASLLATVKEPNPNDPEVRGKSKLPAPSFILMLRNVEDLEGEWGDEIKEPTRSLSSSSVETTTVSSPKNGEARQRVHFKPDPNQKIDPDKLEKFFYWIRERHALGIKRFNNEPKPWTQDPVLQDNFFCSPYRELDKTTAWFRDKIRNPLAEYPEVLFAAIVFRKFNYIPTAMALMGADVPASATWNGGPPDEPRHMKDHPIRSAKKAPVKKAARSTSGPPSLGLFTNWDGDLARRILGRLKQHFTPAHVVASGEGTSKVDGVVNMLDSIWEQRDTLLQSISTCTTMQEAHKVLRQLPTVGGFVAYEYCCDLRFTHIGENWTDTLSWANTGPGAMRGLNRLYNRPLSFQRESYEGWIPEMVDLLNQAMNSKLTDLIVNPYSLKKGTTASSIRLSYKNPDFTVPAPNPLPFELREIESSLCEFDKYMRVAYPLEGEYEPGNNPKQSKRKFKGRN